MNSGNNRMSIDFDAALPSNVYDEETWLVQPPDQPNSYSSPGHVVEWLQVTNSKFIFKCSICFISLSDR